MDTIKCSKCQAMPFVINAFKAVSLCMVSCSSGKGPGNPSSPRQCLEPASQEAERTVTKRSRNKPECRLEKSYLQYCVPCPGLEKSQAGDLLCLTH